MRRASVAAGVAAALAAAVPAIASAPDAGVSAAEAPPRGHVSAAPPRVEVMVVGRSRVLRSPVSVVARARVVPAGRRRCAVAAGTPLAALAALSAPTFAVRDYGACSATNPNASELLYVRRIGPESASGPTGWVFKVGRRALGIGGANPRARVRAGARVLWFFCRLGMTGCQRTLDLTGPARATPGAPVTFTARAYDDRGRGAPAAGVTVNFAGGAIATTAVDGSVSFLAPPDPGRYSATARGDGLVPSFPARVRVG